MAENEQTDKKAWKRSVGDRGDTVTAFERDGPGGTVYLRWWVDRKEKKESLGFELRNQKGGIIEKRRKEALRKARRKQAELRGEPDPEPDPEMTLERGFELLFRVPGGYYASATRDYREMRRAAEQIQSALGKKTLWEELQASHARELWRALAEQKKRSGKGGGRWAERVVALLYTAAEWLEEEGHIERAPSKPKNWKRRLKGDWTAIVGQEPRVEQPRFSGDEVRRLDRGVEHPDLDERARLLFDLAFGQRAGQHLRARRRNVDLERTPEQPWGRFYVEGQGRKPGGWLYLTERQHHRLTAALEEGYLSELEARYHAGEIDDYCLFPAGRLVEGKARPDDPMKPLDRSWAHARFRELQALAGVEHRPGRGWHGVRRTASDLAEDETKDTRVLQKAGGWTNEAIRKHYQDKERPDIGVAAAELTEQIRRGGASEDGAASQEEDGEAGAREPVDLAALARQIEALRERGEDVEAVLRRALGEDGGEGAE